MNEFSNFQFYHDKDSFPESLGLSEAKSQIMNRKIQEAYTKFIADKHLSKSQLCEIFLQATKPSNLPEFLYVAIQSGRALTFSDSEHQLAKHQLVKLNEVLQSLSKSEEKKGSVIDKLKKFFK